MKTRGVLLLTTLTLLCCGTSLAEHGFRPRQEYSFELQGRTVAGLPTIGDKQHAGLHYQGTVRVQRDTANSFLLRFQNVSYTNLHENLPGGWWSEARGSRDSFKELPITSSTVAVKLGRFDVESVAVKKGLEKWEINFIQGVVNQLYISSPVGAKQKGSLPSISYKSRENSLFGRCEVLYEISKVPKSVAISHPDLYPRTDICGSRSFYEIFKTRNFSNCENAPEFHFGLPNSKKCPPGGNECEDFWTRASVTRISGCGDRNDFEILQTETNTRMIANLYLHNGSQASVSSFISLNLKSVRPISRHLSPPSDSQVITDLKFQYVAKRFDQMSDLSSEESSEEAVDAENNVRPTPKSKRKSKKSVRSTSDVKHKMDKAFLYQHMSMDNPPVQPLSPFAQVVRSHDGGFNKMIQNLRELITDASNEMEVPKSISERMTLDKIVYAVKICRTMSYTDLSKTAAIISLQSRSNKMLITERKLLRDILVMCGTSPSFRILKGWLQNKGISGEEANGVLAAIPSHLQTPDSGTITEFYNLAKELSGREEPQLKTTAILALSNLLRVACVQTDRRESHYYTKNFNGRCTTENLSNYLPWFVAGAKSDGPYRRVFITALGNIGNASALPHLRAIAVDPSASAYIRTTAVYSMKYQVFTAPDQTSQVLSSLYRDAALPVPVRIAAVSLLLYTKPSLVTMQKIAVYTWYDPSPAVAAFVRSTLLSLAKVKDPVYQSMARYAGMVLPLSRPMPLGLNNPYNLMWSRVLNELQEVILTQMSYDSSLDATNIYFRYTQRHGGLSRTVLEAEMFASNLDLFLTKMRDLVQPSEDITIFRPAMQGLSHSTKWIRESLKISERTLPKFEGDIHLIWDKIHERMLPMDKQFFLDIAKGGRNFVEEMKNGKEFNYQKVNQKYMTLQVITELGFPVMFEMIVPWAFRATANGKINVEEKRLEMDINIMYASQLISEVSFYSGLDETIHVAGSHGLTLINTPPVKLTASLNTQDRTLQISFKALQPQADNIVLHHSNKPFTSQHNVFNLYPNTLKAATALVHTGRSLQRSKSLLSAISINYMTESSNESLLMLLKKAVSVQGFCLMWSSLEASSMEVEINKFESVNLQFALDHATVTMNKIDILAGGETPTSTQKPETTITAATIDAESKNVSLTSPVTAEPTSMPITITAAPIEKSTDIESLINFPYYDRMLPQFVGAADESLTIVPNTTTTITTQSVDTTTVTPATLSPAGTTLTAATIITAATTKSANRTTQTAASIITPTTEPNTARVTEELDVSSGRFNASNISPFNKASRADKVKYILTEMLDGISNGKALLLSVQADVDDNEEKSYNAYLTHAFGRGDKDQRLGVFLQRKQSAGQHTQFKLTSRLKTPISPMLKLDSVLNGNVTASLTSDVVYETNNTEYKISVKTTMGRDQEKLEELQDSDCIAEDNGPEKHISQKCIQEAAKAMLLDRFNFTITYNEESKEFGPTAKHLFNYARYWFLPYITEDNEYRHNAVPANTIKAVFNMSSRPDSMNAWICSRNFEAEFSNIPANSIVSDMIQSYPSVGLQPHFKGGKYCAHGGGQWTTFDGMNYGYNLSTCWHVLSKDCSGRSRVAILARRVDDKLEVEVNLDNYKVLSLKPGLEATVNGEPVEYSNNIAEFKDEAGTLLLRVEKSTSPEAIASVSMPAHAFDLLYTEQIVLITAGAKTRNRLCGLCGDNNGDISNDFTNPRGLLESNARSFGATYSLLEGRCNGKEPI